VIAQLAQATVVHTPFPDKAPSQSLAQNLSPALSGKRNGEAQQPYVGASIREKRRNAAALKRAAID